MTDRDRLIELHHEAGVEWDNYLFECLDNGKVPSKTYDEFHADYLIANGVIVPPCKVGDMVYQIKYCRCGNPENYEMKHCHKKDTKKTPIVLGSIMKQQCGMRPTKNYDWSKGTGFAWQPIGTICYKIIQKPFKLEWLTEIGKTVFLTKEEAEAKLKEREGK